MYYGFASVSGGPVYKAVTSVGWNPHYENEEKSIEVHILHEFDKDFYGEELRFLFLGKFNISQFRAKIGLVMMNNLIDYNLF